MLFYKPCEEFLSFQKISTRSWHELCSRLFNFAVRFYSALLLCFLGYEVQYEHYVGTLTLYLHVSLVDRLQHTTYCWNKAALCYPGVTFDHEYASVDLCQLSRSDSTLRRFEIVLVTPNHRTGRFRNFRSIVFTGKRCETHSWYYLLFTIAYQIV